MAVNQNQSYVETLREMKATRQMQLRQSGAQAQLMNKQINVLNTMSNLLNKQSQILSRLDSNQKVSNKQLTDVNKNLSSLSSTIAKSFANLSTNIVRSTGQGVMAVGGAAASATGSIATSIASGVGKVLPAAIATYVAKSLVWDNISQQTRNRITSSLGDMFAQAMAGINSTELGKAMTQALTPAVTKIKNVTENVVDKVDAIREKLPSPSEVIRTTKEKAEDIIKSPTTARVIRTGELVGERLGGAARQGYETTKEAIEMAGGAPNVLKGTGLATSAYFVARGVNNLRSPGVTNVPTAASTPITQPPSAGTKTVSGSRMEAMRRVSQGKMDPATKKAIDTLKGSGTKATKLNVAVARAYNAILGGAGNASRIAKPVLEAFKRVKFSIPAVLSALIEYGMLWYVETEIQAMVELDQMSKAEADILISNLRTEAKGRFIGGTVGGTLGAIVAGGSTFGLGSVVGGVAGGLGGSYVGEKIAGLFTKNLPSSLNEEMTLAEQEPAFLGGVSTKDVINQRKNVLERKFEEAQKAKRNKQELPQSNMIPSAPGNYIPGSDAEFVRNRVQREGFRQNPYQSAEGGTPTIGVGHKLTPEEMKAGGVFINGKLVPLNLSNVLPPGVSEQGPKQLTREQVEQLLEQDHKKHEEAVRSRIGADVFDKLSADQRYALGDLSFAAGPGAVSQDLIRMVRSGNTEGVARYLSTYGLYYTKDGKKVYSDYLARGARGRAELYAGKAVTPQTLASTNTTNGATQTATAQTPEAEKPFEMNSILGMSFGDITANYKSLTEKLKTGYENLKQVEMKGKTGSTNIVNGGATTVVNNVQNSSAPMFGGSGVTAAGYTSQFDSLAGARA